MAKTHYFPSDEVHFTWDAGNAPVLTIDSGDTVVVHTRDVSDNQIGPDSTVDVIAGLDWDRVYPLAGPIAVDGAQPGDTLAIEVLDLHTQGWGWTAILPGLGLLADDFPDRVPADLRPQRGRRDLPARGHRDPDRAFLGTMGVCPAGASAQPVMPPGTLRRQHGHAPAHARHHAVPARPGRGRALQLRRRARRPGRRRGLRDRPRVADVLRPALHAAQGPPDPRAAVPTGRAAGAARADGPWYGTTGVGPDLYVGAQEAVRAMVDHLAAEHGLSPEDAYLLCSLCVDLRISEIVDAGEYVVSALLPLQIFSGA